MNMNSGTRIKVVNTDTLDMALKLQQTTTTSPPRLTSNPTSHLAPPSISPHFAHQGDPALVHRVNSVRSRVLVLNMASNENPDQGWLKGAVAQEESIFYRSSLAFSLFEAYYPFADRGAVYSPNVIVIRDAMDAGHRLILPFGAKLTSPTAPVDPPDIAPSDLPIISVISVAPVRRPALKFGKIYANEEDEKCMKDMIRLVLRLAASSGHTKLVLGALGCGVLKNPPAEVARCFLDVLREMEFRGGWFEDVVFAVLDVENGEKAGVGSKGNFGTFFDVLDGKIV